MYTHHSVAPHSLSLVTSVQVIAIIIILVCGMLHSSSIFGGIVVVGWI